MRTHLVASTAVVANSILASSSLVRLELGCLLLNGRPILWMVYTDGQSIANSKAIVMFLITAALKA